VKTCGARMIVSPDVVLDVFIPRLRKHLSSSKKIAINRVYGVGFIFQVEE
jgi:DNA-binding response OmpR family regulator